MGTRYLESLFNPSSIVVVGASERADNLGGMVLRNLLGGGYPGRMLVINQSSYESVHGVPCVDRVSHMDFSPELAIVCTPPDTVPKVVRRLGKAGVRTAMVMTGGMSRAHSRTGQPLMYSVSEAARETGIRVLGPNTIGLMVPARSLNATYAHMGALPGKVAFVGQSGSLACGVIDWAFARGVGFSYFLTLGDSMDIDHDDLIDYLAQDSQTRAILLHIESIPNPRRFMSAVRVAARTKPVIAVKSGRVPESEWFPHELPAGLNRSDPVYDAMLQRAGALRVELLNESPEQVHRLMRVVTDATIWLEQVLRRHTPTYAGGTPIWGAWLPGDAVFMSEDASDLCGPSIYDEFFGPYTRRVADQLGGCYIHHHARGYQVHERIAELVRPVLLQISRDPNCEPPARRAGQLQQQTGPTPLIIQIDLEDLDQLLDCDADLSRMVVMLSTATREEARAAIARLRSGATH